MLKCRIHINKPGQCKPINFAFKCIYTPSSYSNCLYLDIDKALRFAKDKKKW